tara:strand:- start:65487 stop:65906 length:420 start_codon:yes stop_codon:yes gene_type:complete
MELTDRIKYLMKLNNLSASAFADEIGVQRSSVSHILSGRNKPSLDFVIKVLNRFPNVSSDWLLLGKTDVTNVKQEPENKQKGSDVVKLTNVNNSQNTENKANEQNVDTNVNSNASKKEIKKIVIFYSDGTFEPYESTKS